MDNKTYYYFPHKQQVCTSDDDLNFYVIRGGYSFELYSDTALCGDNEWFVGYYEEHSAESLKLCYPEAYLDIKEVDKL